MVMWKDKKAQLCQNSGNFLITATVFTKTMSDEQQSPERLDKKLQNRI